MACRLMEEQFNGQRTAADKPLRVIGSSSSTRWAALVGSGPTGWKVRLIDRAEYVKLFMDAEGA